jgi:deazaflavin-dependent oxidoreductase (nitroreductase family)
MMYLPDEDDPDLLYVFASAGGADRHPAWFDNLVAHPDEVQVEVGTATVPATAEVSPNPGGRCCSTARHRSTPGSPSTQRQTTRVMPVVALTLHRAADPLPTPGQGQRA